VLIVSVVLLAVLPRVALRRESSPLVVVGGRSFISSPHIHPPLALTAAMAAQSGIAPTQDLLDTWATALQDPHTRLVKVRSPLPPRRHRSPPAGPSALAQSQAG